MPISTMTSKAQVTIPKSIRDRLGLKAGDPLIFRLAEDGTLIVQTESESPLGRLPGMLRHLAPERAVTIEEMRQAVHRRAYRKHRSGREG